MSDNDKRRIIKHSWGYAQDVGQQLVVMALSLLLLPAGIVVAAWRMAKRAVRWGSWSP